MRHLIALALLALAVPQTCARAQASTKRIPIQKDGPRPVRRDAALADSASLRAQTDSVRAVIRQLLHTVDLSSAAILARAKTLDSIAAIPPVPPIPDTVRVTVQLPAPPAVHDTVHDTVTVTKVYHDTVRVAPPPVITPPVVPPLPAPVIPPVVNPPPATNSPAALPQDSVDVTMPAIARRVPVPAGTSLQAALNAAQAGDALVLDSAGVWTGNYSLPARSAGWVVVTTNGSIPPAGTRPTFGDTAHMPTVATVNGQPALATVNNAFGWRIIGVHLRTTPGPLVSAPNLNYGIVTLGSFQQTTLAVVPSNLILDRVVIHAAPGTQTSRCVALNSARSAVIDSYLAQCATKGSDAQAILMANGPGPFLIQNNRLEGSGENVMMGGADPAIPGLVPSDIIIRRNYFYKPLAWKGVYTAKNILETKNARRLLVEGNVFENSWVDGQIGFAWTFKSTNQSGACTWCTFTDGTFRYNWVRGAAAGMNLAGHPEVNPVVPAARVLVEQNVFQDIGSNNATCTGRMVQLLDSLSAVTIRKNTFVHNGGCSGSWMLLDNGGQGKTTGLVVQDNIATFGNGYGAIMASGVGGGTPSLQSFAPGFVYGQNCIIGLPANLRGAYPTSTIHVGLQSDIFVSPTDFHVKSGQACAPLGADIDAVLRSTAGVAIP